ncbi:hypothetical protein [Salmonirosea aquatica]|uniref:Uncharacterized protein n=1 Tax=Salmonirosea aquatica TaxID=2654236 RepID=A0A7C9BUZ1_9BACT|nr:hypothetical protein [Cytophagaceae bacterium SJW1-29]
MTRNYIWKESELDQRSHNLWERIEYDNADGMPMKQDTRLATINPEGLGWDAIIWRPEGDVLLPGFAFLGTAMAAVTDYLTAHETIQA